MVMPGGYTENSVLSGNPTRKVAFPIVTRMREDIGQLQRWYLKLLNILAIVHVPLLGLPMLAPLLLSDRWVPSVPLVQILAALFVLRAAGNAGGTLMFGVIR